MFADCIIRMSQLLLKMIISWAYLIELSSDCAIDYSINARVDK